MCVSFLFACERDAISELTIGDTPGVSPEMTLRNQLLKERLLNVRAVIADKSKVPGEKSTGQVFTPAEAKWAIQAVANVTFSRKLDNLTGVSSSTDSIEVPLANGVVSEEDLRAGYLAAHQILLSHYLSVQQPVKQVLTTILKTGPETSTSARFYVITDIGISENDPLNTCGSYFDDGLSYWVGSPVTVYNGFCEGTDMFNFNGTTVLNDAFKSLVDENILGPPNAPIFGGWVELNNGNDFLDPVYVDDYVFYPNSDNSDGPQGDGYRDYLVYFYDADAPESLVCFDDDELNWLLCNYYDIATNLAPPEDYILATGSVYFAQDGCSCPDKAHELELFYGIPIFVSDDDGYSPTDGPMDDDVFDDFIVGQCSSCN